MVVKITSEQELIELATEAILSKMFPDWESIKPLLLKTSFFLSKTNRPCKVFNGRKFNLYKGEKYFRGSDNTRMHVYVWEYYNGKTKPGFDVHHKDHNRFNNDISNLELISEFEHHSAHMKDRYSKNKEWFIEFAKKGRETGKEWFKTEEGRKQKSQRIKKGKKIWANVPIRTSNCELCGEEMTYKCIQEQKYCSPKCKQRALVKRMQIIKKCEFCGKDFSAYEKAKPPVRFCSKSCSSKNMHKNGHKNKKRG